MPQEFVANVTIWDGFNVDIIDMHNSGRLCEVTAIFDIAYTPNSPAAKTLVSKLAQDMETALKCPVLDAGSTADIIKNRLFNGTLNDVLNDGLFNASLIDLHQTDPPVFIGKFYDDYKDLFRTKFFRAKPFDSVSAMDDYIINYSNSTQVFVGLIFADSWKDAETLPNNLDYQLRPPAAPRSEQSGSGLGSAAGWLTNLLFPTSPGVGPRDKRDKHAGKPHYYEEGFVTAQHLLDINFLKLKSLETNISFSTDDFTLQMQRFPYPPYPSDPYIEGISRNLPFIVLLCFIYLGQQTAKSVSIERDTGLKEYMMMMGLSRTALWTSYFIHYFCMFLVSVSIVTLVFCCPMSANGAIINYTNWSIVYVLLILYGISLINMGFMISTWFQTANAVAATTGVLIFIFYLPYGFIQQNIDGTPAFAKTFCSFLSPVAMSFGFSQISSWESRGIGIQWSNVADPVSSSNQSTMLQTYILLIFDSLLYYALARYVDVVKPGRWGVGRKWYFLCSPSYWCPKNEEILDATDGDDTLMEPIPPNHTAGFQLNKVIKTFDSGTTRKRAVDNLSFVALDSQITVLLGHNGAGKSTTMNMLSGMLEADEGQCFVGNVNVAQNVEKAREGLGLCPQHNILVRELTVREHLRLFAELKGFTREEADTEIETLAQDVQLQEKIDQPAYDLSGGMKRKLSLGIALCGGSTNLILDEPSSGIDVRARRELWSILEKYRKNRTMLLSTHYMDEAEHLADRIVIIGGGKLKCSGSTNFLKQNLGSGYHLTMSLMDNANLTSINQFVQNITPAARLDKFYGKEAQYILPFESSNSFPTLFRELDQNRQSIQVQNYGVSVTTMDEIFLKVTSDGKENVNETADIQEELLLKLANRITLLKGNALMLQQLRGAFVKCAIHASRNWKVIAMQVILPAIMTILAAVQILAIPVIGYQDPLNLSLKPYKSKMGGKLSITSIYTAYNDTSNGSEFVDAIGGDSSLENLTSIFANGTKVELVNWIPKNMEKDLYGFNDKYVIGMETGYKNPVTTLHTWFNGEALHAIASGVLYADRTLVELFFSGSNISISASNFPLPATLSQSLEKNTSFAIQGSIISFNLIIGLMIMFSAFSMLPVRERATGVKTMQKCSGAPLWLCWMAEYLWDLINCFPPILVTLIIFAAFQNVEGIKAYVDNMDAIFVLIFTFALAQLPFGYCCSFMFDTAASALTYCSVINMALGLVTMITVTILEFPVFELVELAKSLDHLFCILPQYDLARGLSILYLNANIKTICTETFENAVVCKLQNITYVT